MRHGFRFLRTLARHAPAPLGGTAWSKRIVALLRGARVFEGTRAKRLALRAEKLLARELPRRIQGDGLHVGRSSVAHAQVFADLCECLRLLQPSPLRTQVEAELRAMSQALINLTHPDGSLGRFGERGARMEASTQECLAVYEDLTGRRPIPSKHFGMHEGGFFGARDRDSLVIVDCGPIVGAPIADADVLGFEWSLDGERFLVGAGTGRGMRVRLERYEAIGDGFLLIGSHDGDSRGPGRVRHQREIAAGARRIQVVDRIEGGFGESMCSRLVLHPDVRFERRGRTLILTRGGTIVQLDCDHPVTVEDSSWCNDFGERIATRQLTIWYGAAPGCGGFTLQCAPSLAERPFEIVAERKLLDAAASR